MLLERVSRTDRGFLELDHRPELVSTLGVLYVLDGNPAFERVTSELETYVQLIPRAQQHVAKVNGRLVWRDVVPYNVTSYVARRDIGPNATLDQLLAEVSELYCKPWPRDQPMARASVIDGLEGGRLALLIELSHAISDGLGLLRGIRVEQGEGEGESALDASPFAGAREYLRGQFGDISAQLVEVARVLARAGRSPRSRRAAYAEARSFLRHLGELRAGHERPRLAPSARREIYGFRVPLELWTHAAKERHGGVNDLFLAAAATAFLRTYRASNAPLCSLRVVMPINLRSENDADAGNKVLRGLVRLPAHDDLLEDLQAVAAASRSAQRPEHVPVGPLVDAIQSLLPRRLHSAFMRRSLAYPDFVATNLKFPMPAMQFAGVDVVDHFVIGPTTGPPALFALCTYDDVAYFTLTLDPAQVPDPALLRQSFQAAIDTVIATTGARS